MTISTKTTLKTYFETNDKPSQSQFADFIDSCLNLAETSSQTVVGSISVSGNLTVAGTVSAGTLSLASLSTGIVSASNINATGTLKVDGATTLGSTVTLTGAATFGSTVAGFSTLFNNQVGTSYTFVSSDCGKTVTFTNGSTVSAMLPNNMGLGFTCEVIQLGAGQVSFFVNSGATLQNRSSQTKLAGLYAAGRLSVVSVGAGTSATYNLAGDTG